MSAGRAGAAPAPRGQGAHPEGARSQNVRCAIYTRKSSDEGLEQAFNSLDAQREACGAYILSQASEGWSALPEIYDDGGLSGGTLERPALQRLLAEVAAGRVDIIVVYKVDRLTRSLFDFAKLVETFDARGTSFVSVTQSFNTTTSMGRLTLNMLLSFAQFEREVTAERIRDKIAASKARGMWMGGTPPLGYAPNGRTLVIVEDHAAIVTRIFERYLALGNVRLLEAELASDGIRNPVRQRRGGASFGDSALARGQLYTILANPIYIGRIPHRDRSYQGLHAAIIGTGLWDEVQAKLADNRQGERIRSRAASPSLLAGQIVDASGNALIASHASKPGPSGIDQAGRRFRYYVSRSLTAGPVSAASAGATSAGIRMPALEIEAAVTQRIAEAFDDPFALAGRLEASLTPGNTAVLADRAATTAARLRRRDRQAARSLVHQVKVHPGHIEIDCATGEVAAALGVEAAAGMAPMITFISEVILTRSGRAMRLVQGDGAAATRAANPALVKLVVKARRWWSTLREGQHDVTSLAATEGVMPAYITRVVRLAFLSPAVTDAILKGGLRAAVNASMITAPEAVAACWKAQALAMLPVVGAR